MSENYYIIDDKKIFYTIKKRNKQKRIRFIIYQDGSLVVTAPKVCRNSWIKKEIIKNSDWIVEQTTNKKCNITIDENVIKYMKKSLRPIVEAKLLQFNSYYNFTYNRISIRHQKTRWGSCSSENNLNFNCKLMCVSDELKDYIIVHELCHLREMNHSKQFWQLVEKTIPDYKELKKELKKLKI